LRERGERRHTLGNVDWGRFGSERRWVGRPLPSELKQFPVPFPFAPHRDEPLLQQAIQHRGLGKRPAYETAVQRHSISDEQLERRDTDAQALYPAQHRFESRQAGQIYLALGHNSLHPLLKSLPLNCKKQVEGSAPRRRRPTPLEERSRPPALRRASTPCGTP